MSDISIHRFTLIMDVILFVFYIHLKICQYKPVIIIKIHTKTLPKNFFLITLLYKEIIAGQICFGSYF